MDEQDAINKIKQKRLTRKRGIVEYFKKLYAKYKIWKMKKNDPFIYED
tara:strand:- start:1 stop:144 length:144 start_codon:yes stop_codon:yes gene_type:complete